MNTIDTRRSPSHSTWAKVGILGWMILAWLLIHTGNVLAATYYLSPTASDANSGTSASPWQTFTKAWSVMAPGDTLILKDGTYNQNPSPSAGKSGVSGSVIAVQAENDGGAKITSALEFRGNAYLAFIGFKITGTGHAVGVGSNGTGSPSHHLTFQKIGFTCTDTTLNDDACFAIGDGTHHLLLEDSWGWGGGRYTVMCYGGPGGNPKNTTCDNNTFRRLVLRMGPSTSTGGNPQAALSLYYASNNIVENVIAVDGQPASDSSNAAFYITAHVPPPNVADNKYYGVIALNNRGIGLYLDADNGANASNTQIRNSVFWGSPNGGMAFYISGTCTGTVVDHVTSGANGDDGLWNYCSGTSIRSSIFVNNATYGISQGGQGSSSSNYNDFFGNSSGPRANISAGSNDLTSNPQLKYILRTEPGTPCKGAGEGGTDCGADLGNRYQDGIKTGVSLWPWPNEARIKADMCTGTDATRGFCSKTSLTEYIWTYLGNPMPLTSQLAAPKNLTVR